MFITTCYISYLEIFNILIIYRNEKFKFFSYADYGVQKSISYHDFHKAPYKKIKSNKKKKIHTYRKMFTLGKYARLSCTCI